MRAPFPWFGGKRDVVDLVWARLGSPKQYIEPFLGSAAILLGKPEPASLEVIGDLNGFVANFWRCVVHQPDEAARWADYPVSHIDQGARHRWLMTQRDRLSAELQDPDWPGDAKIAGWWLWGQCSWIGSGWCDWWGKEPVERTQIPHVSDAGMGVQAIGQIPHVSNAGRGEPLTSGGLTAREWLRKLAARMERCRVIHGEWSRCLNHHYGGNDTAIFFDPPYAGTEEVYGGNEPVSQQVGKWCSENAHLRIALCGHAGEHALPGWDEVAWKRKRLTYSSNKTTDLERVWFSPACIRPADNRQTELFGGAA